MKVDYALVPLMNMSVSYTHLTKTLKVKPAEDFSDLTYVSVVFRGNNNE